MKIIINRCWGGFSLSHAAVMEYAKRKGIVLYAYLNDRDADNRLKLNCVVPWDGEGKTPFCVYYATAPAVDGHIAKNHYFSDRDIPRNDVDLVAVVEAMGDAANGCCAELKVVEIPDEVDDWEISEYDGMEHVAQKHETWS